MNWTKVRDELERDGALRDLYVSDTTVAEWDVFLKALPSWPYRSVFTVDGQEAPLPTTAAEAFNARQSAILLLHVDVAGLTVAAHFFDEGELELDIDPSELSGESSLAALSGFIRRLGDLLAKPVALTYENSPKSVIATYDPTGQDFTYPQ